MSLVCYNDYSESIRAIHQFLNNYPEIKDECLNLFNKSPKEGIVKLTEYLDKVNLYCPMLYKKQILNETKWKLEEQNENYKMSKMRQH